MSGEIYVQDFAALETLFKRFYKPLRAYAFRFVNDKDLSEDIVQDVFLYVWETVKSYMSVMVSILIFFNPLILVVWTISRKTSRLKNTILILTRSIWKIIKIY